MKVSRPTHTLLGVLALPLAIALLTACSSSDSVPSDQDLKPAAAPSGWQKTTLDHVTISAPPAWTNAGTSTTSETITSTTWRTEAVNNQSSAGMEVREISKPSNSAEDAANGLAVNAMATMKGGKPDTEQLKWPNAEDAWTYSTVITVGPKDKTPQEYVSTTFVADLADGSQVQVLVFTLKGEDDDLGHKILQTISLPGDK